MRHAAARGDACVTLGMPIGVLGEDRDGTGVEPGRGTGVDVVVHVLADGGTPGPARRRCRCFTEPVSKSGARVDRSDARSVERARRGRRRSRAPTDERVPGQAGRGRGRPRPRRTGSVRKVVTPPIVDRVPRRGGTPVLLGGRPCRCPGGIEITTTARDVRPAELDAAVSIHDHHTAEPVHDRQPVPSRDERSFAGPTTTTATDPARLRADPLRGPQDPRAGRHPDAQMTGTRRATRGTCSIDQRPLRRRAARRRRRRGRDGAGRARPPRPDRHGPGSRPRGLAARSRAPHSTGPC